MKYPLDRLCIKSKLFCQSCLRKIESGFYDNVDLGVMGSLVDLEDSLKELKKGEYVKSYKVNDTYIVIVKNNFTKTELENLSREVSSRMNTKFRFIQDHGDKKKLVEQILQPYRVLGINTVYLPNGEEQYVIRIQGNGRKSRSRFPLEGYIKVAESILGKKVKFVFEQSI
uniref:Transcription elongation factor n=1 Tax=Staphylothermus marinus TaxID=2280 RepID=A0A7C4NNC9_STAMA